MSSQKMRDELVEANEKKLSAIDVAVAAERERCAKLVEGNCYRFNENREQPWASSANLAFNSTVCKVARLIRNGAKA